LPPLLAAAACNLDNDLLSACLPLLEESRIEAIEWSFDALYGVQEVPSWFLDLLTAYSTQKRLIGHGVFFSLFSGKWLQEQEEWLKHLRQTCRAFQFDHITEHFGFMTGRDFHQGAPLNIPYTDSTLRIGQDRLKRIYEACHCPVGLENLAFSYSLEEVKRHGDFLDRLLEPVNGFLILDLHNLYCQLHNFNLGFEEIIALYPLEKVREIHISGGSWDQPQTDPARSIRRDTHDAGVPPEVFALLHTTIDRCPNLKYVVLEQLGIALTTTESRKTFYDDFLQLETIVKQKNSHRFAEPYHSFLPAAPIVPGPVVEDEALYRQQQELSAILESAASTEEALYRLHQSSLAHSGWLTEQWDPCMVETAMKIAQKWKKGWNIG
jgi:uncharacterized protein (UPF0276 family)